MDSETLLSPKKKGLKVMFVSPDVTETKNAYKKARTEGNQKNFTVKEGKSVEICIISPQSNKKASTDENNNYVATDSHKIFSDENIDEENFCFSGKTIEIIDLDGNRHGVLVDKRWTVQDVVRENKKNLSDKTFLRDNNNVSHNDKDIAHEILDRDIPYYLQIETGEHIGESQ